MFLDIVLRTYGIEFKRNLTECTHEVKIVQRTQCLHFSLNGFPVFGSEALVALYYQRTVLKHFVAEVYGLVERTPVEQAVRFEEVGVHKVFHVIPALRHKVEVVGTAFAPHNHTLHYVLADELLPTAAYTALQVGSVLPELLLGNFIRRIYREEVIARCGTQSNERAGRYKQSLIYIYFFHIAAVLESNI